MYFCPNRGNNHGQQFKFNTHKKQHKEQALKDEERKKEADEAAIEEKWKTQRAKTKRTPPIKKLDIALVNADNERFLSCAASPISPRQGTSSIGTGFIDDNVFDSEIFNLTGIGTKK